MVQFLGSITLVTKKPDEKVVNVERGDLPYPSLNEVNYLAFGESNDEYHNELYGFIESEQLLVQYKTGKQEMLYKKECRNSIREEQRILSEYIRHQIHHPENKQNVRFTFEQLQESISLMRKFIQDNN